MAFTDALAHQLHCCIHRLATDQYLCRVALHNYYYVLQQAAHKNFRAFMIASNIALKLSCNYQRFDPHTPLKCRSLSTNSAKFTVSKNSVATMK